MTIAPGRVAVVIRHLGIAHLGSFAPVLAAHGYQIRYIEALEMADAEAADATRTADLVVVLGGDMGVYERDENAFIAHELTALAARLESEKATLGVCLGAQMMA